MFLPAEDSFDIVGLDDIEADRVVVDISENAVKECDSLDIASSLGAVIAERPILIVAGRSLMYELKIGGENSRGIVIRVHLNIDEI